MEGHKKASNFRLAYIKSLNGLAVASPGLK